MSLIQASLEISLLYFQCIGTLYTSGECRGERQPLVPPPHLSQGLDDQPPLSEGLDLPLLYNTAEPPLSSRLF